jgi:hypothetical protein
MQLRVATGKRLPQSTKNVVFPLWEYRQDERPYLLPSQKVVAFVPGLTPETSEKVIYMSHVPPALKQL